MYLSWPKPKHEEDDEEVEEDDDSWSRCWLRVVHSETGLDLHAIEVEPPYSTGEGVWRGVARLHEGQALFSCCAHPFHGLGSIVKYRRQRKLQAATPTAGGASAAAAAIEDGDDDDFFGGTKQKKEKREKKGKIPLVKDKVGQKGTRGGKSRTG